MNTSFNFYGAEITVRGTEQIISKIKKDFSYFCSEKSGEQDFTVSLNLNSPDFTLIPEGLTGFSYPEFIMYSGGGIKYIDYRGECLSVFDIRKKEIDVFSENKDLLHEIGYLAVLSFAGEILEHKGIFRIHALSFKYNNRGIMLSTSSGSGKTTLFLELINIPGLNFFSDDVALINNKYEMLPFPLRIGLKEEDKDKFKNIPDDFIYELQRRKYGKKILLDSVWFREKIAEPVKIDTYFTGKRWNSATCKINKINKVKFLISLFENFIVGVGLPQLIEYLNLEFSARELIRLSNKAVKRMVFAVGLILRCSSYSIYLGRNIENNVRTLLDFLDRKR